MKKKLLVFFLVCFSLVNISVAQSNCVCCTRFHEQFDFWIGDWNVYDTTGNKVGENQLVKLEKNCIVSEYWRGVKGSTGRSYNYFNTSDSTWNQIWLDSYGTILNLKGRYEGNKMILKSKLTKGTKVDWYYNQITWTNNNDGTVTQTWEILDKNAHLLNTVFVGIYKKK